jgi:hypothetical protein
MQSQPIEMPAERRLRAEVNISEADEESRIPWRHIVRAIVILVAIAMGVILAFIIALFTGWIPIKIC